MSVAVAEKLTAVPAVPEGGSLNVTVGATSLTVTVTVLNAGIPSASVTVNWAVYVPGLA